MKRLDDEALRWLLPQQLHHNGLLVAPPTIITIYCNIGQRAANVAHIGFSIIIMMTIDDSVTRKKSLRFVTVMMTRGPPFFGKWRFRGATRENHEKRFSTLHHPARAWRLAPLSQPFASTFIFAESKSTSRPIKNSSLPLQN
jgi:hypothetical protein